MDYELRIVVEKVAISSQEVIKRDTITSYALQCPTSNKASPQQAAGYQ